MELSDLIMLQVVGNGYVGAMELGEVKRKNPDLEIDLENETWSWKDFQKIPIGERVPDKYLNGPIGIYKIKSIEDIKKGCQCCK